MTRYTNEDRIPEASTILSNVGASTKSGAIQTFMSASMTHDLSQYPLNAPMPDIDDCITGSARCLCQNTR